MGCLFIWYGILWYGMVCFYGMDVGVSVMEGIYFVLVYWFLVIEDLCLRKC